MAWKPKEKPLTPEEAVELARKELAPLWMGTSPLFAGVRGADGRCSVHPLDPAFEKRVWLLLFVDLTCYAGEAALKYLHEWRRRYSGFEVIPVLVVRSSFSFLSSVRSVEPSLGKFGDPFPVVLDLDGAITAAFSADAQGLPAIRLLHQRKVGFSHAGPDWAQKAEEDLQRYLRIKDPGLALFPPFQISGSVSHEAASAELGSRARSPLFAIEGKAGVETDRVVVRDPATLIRFTSPHARVSLVAQALGAPEIMSRIRVELIGDTVFEAAAGEHLSFGDDGGSELRVSQPRLYHLLQGLPAKARDVVLRFPDADRVPVALYVVRFAD